MATEDFPVAQSEYIGHSGNWGNRSDFQRSAPRPDEMPFMWIEEREKYADVTVDFIFAEQVTAGLTEDAAEEVDHLTELYMGKAVRWQKEHSMDDLLGFGNSFFIGIHNLEIRFASEYAEKLAKVVFDETNWRPAPDVY